MVTQRGLNGLGSSIHKAFTDSTPDNVVGDAVNRALRAAVKAVVVGDQTHKQIDQLLTKARKAFVRQLSREV